ncbi:MAG: beta-hydroxyacyl-ACP dehydratase [Planctomycetes bacterium]|nr:beta-hydroxyacyl-ACP dehydratase [Planctomycetota bacterium]
MRWFLLDRFEEFVRCRRATAIKAVTLAEEHLHDHVPGWAIVPNTLVLEGLAQTAGILVADAIDYRRQVVLAKVGVCEFHFDAMPGDVLRYEVELVELSEDGSVVQATSRVGGRPHGRAELFFGHLASGDSVPKLFSNEQFNRWLDNLRIYEVAREHDGTPVTRNRVRVPE